MRIDWYTKGVLTVIAAMLGLIAIRPFVSPDAVAHAQGPFTGVQVNLSSFFDSRTGDIWGYKQDGTLDKHLRLTKLGSPLLEVK
jgi:hypothetical protein